MTHRFEDETHRQGAHSAPLVGKHLIFQSAVAAIVLALLAFGVAEAEPAAPQQIARGVTLIPGTVPADRGPDGNTVVFDGPRGLIVVDTGRHIEHSDAILAFARAQDRPIAAIVNTHWHLDHTSGNRRIKAVFPEARVYATSGIDAVLAPGGFLERGLARARARVSDATVPEAERVETALFLETMDNAQFLRPDIVASESGRMRIARRRFDVRVTNGAVSEADIWLYDSRTRVAVLGDLVTFPSPFFESACPDAWRAELDAVWTTPFALAIPGHGEPMSRAQFDVYRSAFNAFMDCVGSESEASICTTIWADGVAEFLSDEHETSEARAYASYYVGFLRANGGKSPDCAAD